MYSDGTARSSSTSRKGDKLHKALLYFLALLSLVLLILVIWLGVENSHRKNDIAELRSMIKGSSASGYSGTSSSGSATSATLNGQNLTVSIASYPAVYLSQNSTAVSGYTFGGSLYRGSGYWAQQPPLQTARADFVAFNVNETLYIVGGHDSTGQYLKDGQSWDARMNNTGNVSDMPSSRSHFGGALSSDNATLYVVGGYSSRDNETSNRPESCNLVYNVAANSWSTGACLNQARGATCVANVNGKIFAVGGLGEGGAPLSSVEQYHSSNNTWTVFANLPTNRSSVGCAPSGNNLIIAGGTAQNNSDYKEVWSVDSSSGTLTRLADLLYPRFGLSLVPLPGGDVLAVGGGQHINSTQAGVHNIERYSAAANQWVEKAEIANQRFGLGAVYADEGVYALGGRTYCNASNSTECDAKITTATEIFYDSNHPDVFVHIQAPGGQGLSSAPNSTQVLLLTTSSGINGYQDAGSLYRGSGYWAQGQNMPQALSDLNVVGYGNSVFIVGGLELDGSTVVDTLYKYDPILDTYTNMSRLPEPRTRGGADILGGNLYYVGGYTSGDETAEPVDTMLVYNITADSWSVSNATLSSPRSDLCMAAVNGTLYAAGGYSTNYTDILNLAEKYDPNTNSWVEIASMPTPRGDVMCAALNGKFVAAGGYYDPSGEFKPASFRSEVQAYSPATDTWTNLAPLPVARGDAAMTAVPSEFGDRLLVLGGETEIDNEHTGVATHQVQEYSSILDEWTLKAPMITPRFRHDATYAEGHVLSFGGASSSVCSDTGDGLSLCTLRPVATVGEFFDTDDPDVFVYIAN